MRGADARRPCPRSPTGCRRPAPTSCLHEGQRLVDWHPLISGDPESVHLPARRCGAGRCRNSRCPRMTGKTTSSRRRPDVLCFRQHLRRSPRNPGRPCEGQRRLRAVLRRRPDHGAGPDRLREIFEAPEAVVYLVATGTAANALAMSLACPPWGAVFCHRYAHVAEDECDAPEFFTGGAKLVAGPGRAWQDDARDAGRAARADGGERRPRRAARHAVAHQRDRGGDGLLRGRDRRTGGVWPRRRTCPSTWTARALPMRSSPPTPAPPR